MVVLKTFGELLALLAADGAFGGAPEYPAAARPAVAAQLVLAAPTAFSLSGTVTLTA